MSIDFDPTRAAQRLGQIAASGYTGAEFQEQIRAGLKRLTVRADEIDWAAAVRSLNGNRAPHRAAPAPLR